MKTELCAGGTPSKPTLRGFPAPQHHRKVSTSKWAHGPLQVREEDREVTSPSTVALTFFCPNLKKSRFLRLEEAQPRARSCPVSAAWHVQAPHGRSPPVQHAAAPLSFQAALGASRGTSLEPPRPCGTGPCAGAGSPGVHGQTPPTVPVAGCK